MAASARIAANIVHVPAQSSIFRFGVADKPTLKFRHDLTIRPGQNWAFVGPAKTLLMEALTAKHRIAPPPPSGGVFPFLMDFNPPKDPHDVVRLASFAYRKQAVAGGGFYDYSARYGAVREEDRVTLRESILSDIEHASGSDLQTASYNEALERLAENVQLKDKLDLPLVALSNGQTRRASILRQLLLRPHLLLLDEPLTGLDKTHRPLLLSLLHAHHARQNPLIILGLRMHDPIPEWVSHVALASEEQGVEVGVAKEMRDRLVLQNSTVNHLRSIDERKKLESNTGTTVNQRIADVEPDSEPATLVDIKGLNITYGDRKVLQNINWTIREGERWHLSGPNGSGKTTLLSTLTGEHPQSYIQSSLTLFSSPRRSLATAQIASRIGITSPEIFNAFPRRGGSGGMTVRDVLGSGYEGTYSFRPRTAEQDAEIDRLLAYFSAALPQLTSSASSSSELASAVTSAYAATPFASLPVPHQSLTLFLRALVGAKPLIILDEPLSGMDDHMVRLARQYLWGELTKQQAVVWVSHWDGEMPWRPEQVKKIQLGNATP
ncbi:P-loop containing nucleoside triphosphate hydrolase protein [Clavulina sp. PMI_390]|nr:P-loop containing nucleoside triphosphate hydrolase protein [Clavulina sp. PMI_390]